MSTTTPPAPGSARAVVDVVVRVVSEGRYRYGRLHLLQQAEREPLDEITELVNEATAVPDAPLGFTPAAVIQTGKPDDLPSWLQDEVDDEIIRICSGAPVASSDPTRLVARLIAAICIDVSVDRLAAASRGASADSGATPDVGVEVDGDVDVDETPAAHSRTIHLDAPEVISLAEMHASDPNSAGRR